MKKYAAVAAAIPMLFLSSGCATIVSGTTQKVSVSTQPSGADAKADGNVTIKTPGHLILDRKSEHTIEFSKEGYKTAVVLVRRTFNEMATGNILLGGIIGAGVDAASGSGSKLIPERIDIVLEPGTGSSDTPQFSSKKDQDFYEKNILKNKTQDSAPAKSVPAPSDVKGEAVQESMPPAGSNFSPKAR